MYHSDITKAQKRHISIQDRIDPKRWERIEIAARVGEAILMAKATRSATQRLLPEQIAALMDASGIIDSDDLVISGHNKTIFPRGNLGEEMIHAIADQWRGSNLIFPQNNPSRYVDKPILLAIGVVPVPANYKRKAS